MSRNLFLAKASQMLNAKAFDIYIRGNNSHVSLSLRTVEFNFIESTEDVSVITLTLDEMIITNSEGAGHSWYSSKDRALKALEHADPANYNINDLVPHSLYEELFNKIDDHLRTMSSQKQLVSKSIQNMIDQEISDYSRLFDFWKSNKSYTKELS